MQLLSTRGFSSNSTSLITRRLSTINHKTLAADTKVLNQLMADKKLDLAASRKQIVYMLKEYGTQHWQKDVIDSLLPFTFYAPTASKELIKNTKTVLGLFFTSVHKQLDQEYFQAKLFNTLVRINKNKPEAHLRDLCSSFIFNGTIPSSKCMEYALNDLPRQGVLATIRFEMLKLYLNKTPKEEIASLKLDCDKLSQLMMQELVNHGYPLIKLFQNTELSKLHNLITNPRITLSIPGVDNYNQLKPSTRLNKIFASLSFTTAFANNSTFKTKCNILLNEAITHELMNEATIDDLVTCFQRFNIKKLGDLISDHKVSLSVNGEKTTKLTITNRQLQRLYDTNEFKAAFAKSPTFKDKCQTLLTQAKFNALDHLSTEEPKASKLKN